MCVCVCVGVCKIEVTSDSANPCVHIVPVTPHTRVTSLVAVAWGLHVIIYHTSVHHHVEECPGRHLETGIWASGGSGVKWAGLEEVAYWEGACDGDAGECGVVMELVWVCCRCGREGLRPVSKEEEDRPGLEHPLSRVEGEEAYHPHLHHRSLPHLQTMQMVTAGFEVVKADHFPPQVSEALWFSEDRVTRGSDLKLSVHKITTSVFMLGWSI